MEILELGPDDWQRYRDLRLEALRADPAAFASSHERELAFDETTWRGRLTIGPDGRPNATFVVADRERGDLGTTAVIYTEHHEVPMIVAMWVRPTARGLGVGRRLVDVACDWVRHRDERSVVLWVVHDNESAIALYRSCGFEPTGKVEAAPSNPCANELEMIAALD